MRRWIKTPADIPQAGNAFYVTTVDPDAYFDAAVSFCEELALALEAHVSGCGCPQRLVRLRAPAASVAPTLVASLNQLPHVCRSDPAPHGLAPKYDVLVPGSEPRSYIVGCGLSEAPLRAVLQREHRHVPFANPCSERELRSV